MTTAELLSALARECPNGASFDPMAVRLLRQKVPFDDWQIEDIKNAMFQLRNGLWFSREMILADEDQSAFDEQAMEWLMEYGCFSVERLFRDFCGVFNHIVTLEDCAAFLRHLGLMVTVQGRAGYLCSQPPPSLDDSLAAISETISGWLEEANGTLTFHDIEQALPQLTAEALEDIRAQFLPDVHVAEVGGVKCWCNTEAIHLPADFSEQLTNAVDTLVALEKKVSVTNLEFALNLFYCLRFREEYALTNNDTFMRVCAKHYKGGNNVFPNTKKTSAKANGGFVRMTFAELVKSANKPNVKASGGFVSGKRSRSPNTRFHSLGVPIGAELVFTKDSHITCTVLDDSNQVEYAGKTWSISTLAIHLLGISSANGFCHFSFEGEILWERRLRLERADNHNEYQKDEMLKYAVVQEANGEIIGLDGRRILPSTWRAYKRDGTNPNVAEWVRRVEKGEKVELIALGSGFAFSTMKVMISNYSLYFKVCKLNGIVPEDGTNV